MLLADLRSEISIPIHPIHLCLSVQNHSMVIWNRPRWTKSDHGRPRQSQVQPKKSVLKIPIPEKCPPKKRPQKSVPKKCLEKCPRHPIKCTTWCKFGPHQILVFSQKDNVSWKLNSLDQLCLWKCGNVYQLRRDDVAVLIQQLFLLLQMLSHYM